jgi:hypothetical protein
VTTQLRKQLLAGVNSAWLELIIGWAPIRTDRLDEHRDLRSMPAEIAWI